MAVTSQPRLNTTPTPKTAEPLLTVRNLEVEYRIKRGVVRAVDDISFDLAPNEVLGLAGESGCGKSTVAHAITRVLKPPAHIGGGEIMLQGDDILKMDDETLRDFRWRHMSIVFQSAMNALNPVLNVGVQIIDAIQAHEKLGKQEARVRALELLRMVNIDTDRIGSYPHQLSGGMRQRVVIAIALALNPELVIMDEPTTALDVVVQKQIMDEIHRLKTQFGFSILFITHDLSLLVEFADRIAIMYAGEIVEIASSYEIFNNPKHPYTAGLMNSFATISGPRKTLTGIPGSPPDLISPPEGCRFRLRCALAGQCQALGIDKMRPKLREIAPGHQVACSLLDHEEGAP